MESLYAYDREVDPRGDAMARIASAFCSPYA